MSFFVALFMFNQEIKAYAQFYNNHFIVFPILSPSVQSDLFFYKNLLKLAF